MKDYIEGLWEFAMYLTSFEDLYEKMRDSIKTFSWLGIIVLWIPAHLFWLFIGSVAIVMVFVLGILFGVLSFLFEKLLFKK